MNRQGKWMVRRNRREEPEREAHRTKGGGAEAGAPIKPVVVAKFVDLDSSPIRRRMRHRLCRHRQRVFGVRLSRKMIVVQKFGCEVEMLLQGELSIRVTEKSESRHVSSRMGR